MLQYMRSIKKTKVLYKERKILNKKIMFYEKQIRNLILSFIFQCQIATNTCFSVTISESEYVTLLSPKIPKLLHSQDKLTSWTNRQYLTAQNTKKSK